MKKVTVEILKNVRILVEFLLKIVWHFLESQYRVKLFAEKQYMFKCNIRSVIL